MKTVPAPTLFGWRAVGLSVPVSLPVSPTHSVGMLPLAPGVVNLGLGPERQSGTY